MFFAAFLKNNLRNKTDIMMRVLALDIGDKRIGVAVSDPLGITAQGLETYTRTGDLIRTLTTL